MTTREQIAARDNAPTWDTTPKTNFITAIAAEKWTAQGAISELFDNSLGRQRGNAKTVTAIHDRTQHKLTIIDDGVGMDHIGRLFQLAEGVGMGIGDIGKYGSGGTKALIWLAGEVRIWSLRDGKVMRDHIRWKDHIGHSEWPRVNNKWEDASLRNVPTMLWELGHGTMIEMKIRPERTVNSDRVQADLSRTYSPGIRNGKVLKWITITKGRSYAQTLSGHVFELPDNDDMIVNFNVVVRIDDAMLPATGTVALIDGLPMNQSCVAIGFGHRIVFETRECYVSADGQKKYSGAGVGGWLDLGEGWQDYLTLAKDGIRDDRLRVVLMHHIFKKIETLLKKTEEDQLALWLDGIALDLSNAFGDLNARDREIVEGFADMPARGGFRDDTVNVTVKPFEPFEPNLRVVENNPNKPGAHDPQPKPEPPVTKIQVHLSSDEDMAGQLCQMRIYHVADTNPIVEVNKDHEALQKFLGGGTLERLGFTMLVTREIAGALSANPQMMKRVLSPLLQRALDTLQDEGQRERKLARLLLDSARRPKQAA